MAGPRQAGPSEPESVNRRWVEDTWKDTSYRIEMDIYYLEELESGGRRRRESGQTEKGAGGRAADAPKGTVRI